MGRASSAAREDAPGRAGASLGQCEKEMDRRRPATTEGALTATPEAPT